MQPTHRHLEAALTAGVVFLEAQSTARQLHHADKSPGIVYVVVACVRRQGRCVGSGALDSDTAP